MSINETIKNLSSLLNQLPHELQELNDEVNSAHHELAELFKLIEVKKAKISNHIESLHQSMVGLKSDLKIYQLEIEAESQKLLTFVQNGHTSIESGQKQVMNEMQNAQQLTELKDKLEEVVQSHQTHQTQMTQEFENLFNGVEGIGGHLGQVFNSSTQQVHSLSRHVQAGHQETEQYIQTFSESMNTIGNETARIIQSLMSTHLIPLSTTLQQNLEELVNSQMYNGVENMLTSAQDTLNSEVLRLIDEILGELNSSVENIERKILGQVENSSSGRKLVAELIDQVKPGIDSALDELPRLKNTLKKLANPVTFIEGPVKVVVEGTEDAVEGIEDAVEGIEDALGDINPF
jgi:predicted  nucleic acid-binding Zn-ribbon protein